MDKTCVVVRQNKYMHILNGINFLIFSYTSHVPKNDVKFLMLHWLHLDFGSRQNQIGIGETLVDF